MEWIVLDGWVSVCAQNESRSNREGEEREGASLPATSTIKLTARPPRHHQAKDYPRGTSQKLRLHPLPWLDPVHGSPFGSQLV